MLDFFSEVHYLYGTKGKIPTKEGKILSGMYVCIDVCVHTRPGSLS